MAPRVANVRAPCVGRARYRNSPWGQPKEHRYDLAWQSTCSACERDNNIDDVLCVQVQVDLRMGEVYAFAAPRSE